MNALIQRVPLAALRLTLLLSLGVLSACGGDANETEDLTANGAEAANTESAADHEGEDVVVLDTLGIRLGGIILAAADSISATSLPVTGSITYDANRVSHVGARTTGRVLVVRADLGALVERGQVLATLESADVGQLRAEEHEAEELVRIAGENYAREQRLAEQGISSRKELLLAEADLRRSEAALRSTEERLQVLGAIHDHDAGGQFSIVAPFAGRVVSRDLSLGEMTTPADTLFTVADLSELWIELDIFERDLARVRTGQDVVVSVTAYPDRRFPGRVVYFGDVLDPATRTVPARVEIANLGGVLKPGMFATADIQVDGGPALAVVPQAAVQELEGRRVVFVEGDADGEFVAVSVEVGSSISGDRVTIVSGVRPGDRVVVAGAFALRSELSKSSIGEHGH